MQPVLRIAGVGKAFGAFQALAEVSLEVRPGETLGLIGPNGAGKTTLFNVIAGFLKPDAGQVVYAGQDITAMQPEERVANGLVRTFQKSVVFPELSIRENVALAVRGKAGAGYRWWNSGPVLRQADARAEWLIERGGLTGKSGETVRNLSYGEQRVVDVLISLALEPRLLLLDEPTAGLARAEADRLLDIIRHHDRDTSVVLIAHDLDIVFGVCDRIAVLNLGRVLAVGSPGEVRSHPGVRAAYLGALAEA